jgi:hypothetical protein
VVDEVAAVAVGTVALVEETKAGFCFVGRVHDLVAAQLLRPVGELAPRSVRTEPLQHEILAEGAL